MTRPARAPALAAALWAALAGGAQAVEPPQDQADFRIGYVELADDPRYEEEKAYARIELRPLGRPFPGAEVGLADAEAIGRVIKVRFDLERSAAADADALVATVKGWIGEGRKFVIADLPADALVRLSDAVGAEAVILNASAPDDRLRGADCRANLMHTVPSTAMQTDALMEYLFSKRWDDVLILTGPLPADADLAAAAKRSAQKFGVSVVDERPFALSNDPRIREETNVALMTAGDGYDIVFVADTDGEFGRYVPYQTQAPRPVVGSVGLVADAWHWSWERQGGPQLSSRFEAHAGRRMTGTDWAAWAAMRALTQAVMRSKSTEFGPVRDFMAGETIRIDGVKGAPMQFRPWDHQLRQPMLLVTANAVIARAPISGFLHATNELDTLGPDAPETECRM